MKKFILLCLVSILLTFNVSDANQETSKPNQQDAKYPIIDMHMHIFQWNRYGDPPPPNLITGKRPAARSNTEVIEAYIAEMDRYNIVLAVGSGSLEMVKKMKTLFPNRFIYGMVFPKYTSPVNKRMERWPSLNELRALYESGQLKIMGEITAQYAGVSPDDPKLEPYFALAEELDIPVGRI